MYNQTTTIVKADTPEELMEWIAGRTKRAGFYADDLRAAITKLGKRRFCASDLKNFLPVRYGRYDISQVLYRMFKRGELKRVVKSSNLKDSKPSYKTESVYERAS